MRSALWIGPVFALSLSSAAIAQENEETTETETETHPEIYPSQEGSSGVYHVRGAFTFPSPGAAFEGNDHFWGSTAYYHPDGRAVRGVETRDSLAVNVTDGIDFTASSIFRSYKIAKDAEVNEPLGILSTPIPSVSMSVKVAKIALDRSWAVAVEPFWEIRSSPHDVATFIGASPFGFRLMGSKDFRVSKQWPLRAHLNLGYRFDKSFLIYQDALESGFVAPNVPSDPPLSTQELYDLGVPRSPAEAALGLFRDDQILLGAAVEFPFKRITPFLEYSGEIVLGEINPASSPQRITIGTRLTPRTEYSDLAIDLAVDVGISKKGQLPSTIDGELKEVEVEPPVAFTVGVGWVFGHRQTVVVASSTPTIATTQPTSTPITQPTTQPVLPPETIRIAGMKLGVAEKTQSLCAGQEITICSIKIPNVNALVFVKVYANGKKSAFTRVGPDGAVLEASNAKEITIQNQTGLSWSGKTTSGNYRTIRVVAVEGEYELSYEGATDEEAKIVDEIFIKAVWQ